MSLHHRRSSRIPLILDVEIQHMGKKLGRSCTRNVNPFGVFIETPTTELNIDDFVEMHFADKHKNNAPLIQKGLVVHRSTDGIGVLFAYDKADFRNMLDKEIAGKKVGRVLSS